MSSPLARPNKRWIERAVVRLHQDMSHDRRVRCLSQEIAGELSRRFAGIEGAISGVDIGCGDMGIAEGISSCWPHIGWECLDIYELPAETGRLDPRWRKYRQFDGRRIDRPDKSADFALFTDVLHHVPDEGRLPLLKEAARVANTVIVKDHLEYGMWSRTMLRAMDFIGNWGYGVSVPRRYFTEQSFRELCCHCGLSVVSLRVGIDLYSHFRLNLVLRPKWQFIAVLAGQTTGPSREKGRDG